MYGGDEVIYQIHVSYTNNKISVLPCILMQETPQNYIVKVEGYKSNYVVRKSDINKLFNYNMMFCDNIYDGLVNLREKEKKDIESLEKTINNKNMMILNINDMLL